MKAVILAAGYGTRLQRDVAADRSGSFAHLVGIPKPLLPVGACPLISHWVRALRGSGAVDAIYVVFSESVQRIQSENRRCIFQEKLHQTNDLHRVVFEDWASHFLNVQIVSDQTRSNEERLGAVACLQLAIKHFNIHDHVLVIGGDTLFKEDFSLSEIKKTFFELQSKTEDGSLVLSYQCRDHETQKYGILEVDEDLRVVCMREKPEPAETESRRACPCFYMFSEKTLSMLDSFLEEMKDAPIQQKDAPGIFVSWLIPRKPVYVHAISGRFDVGNLPSYVECDLYFREKLQDVTSYMV